MDAGDPDHAEHGHSSLVIGDKDPKRLSSRSDPVVPPHPPAVAKQVEAATTKAPSGERKSAVYAARSVSRSDSGRHAEE